MERTPTDRFGRIASAIVIILCLGNSAAAAEESLEDAVKATFLARFGSFVGWPAEAFATADALFVICTTGSAGFAARIEQSAVDLRVDGRAVMVRRLSNAGQASGCHVLHLGSGTVDEGLQGAGGAPVLTVTDARYGSVRGAIHFVNVGGRVRFHIDRDQARRHGLSLNARLLDIALTVRDGAS